MIYKVLNRQENQSRQTRDRLSEYKPGFAGLKIPPKTEVHSLAVGEVHHSTTTCLNGPRVTFRVTRVITHYVTQEQQEQVIQVT